MSDTTRTEREISYEWTGRRKPIRKLRTLHSWDMRSHEYELEDSIYDGENGELSNIDVGVRIRSIDSKTELTVKKFKGRAPSGESQFDEYTHGLDERRHPASTRLTSGAVELPIYDLIKIYGIANRRYETTYSKGGRTIRVVEENVTYSNAKGTYSEPLLEVEFENVTPADVRKVRTEIEDNYPLHRISEGKSDRAKRLLPTSNMHIENKRAVKPVRMSAHGGRGQISMKFFHTEFSRFDGAADAKAVDYARSKWEFFAHAVLPVGAEVKEHYHDRTDEIYYILKGSATFTVDGESTVVKRGDCILTRKYSSHSLTSVTSDLEFIAIEIL